MFCISSGQSLSYIHQAYHTNKFNASVQTPVLPVHACALPTVRPPDMDQKLGEIQEKMVVVATMAAMLAHADSIEAARVDKDGPRAVTWVGYTEWWDSSLDRTLRKRV